MRKYYSEKEWLIFLLCLLICLTGCNFTMSTRIGKAKYERTVRLSAPLSPDSTFVAKTSNGSITIDGADVTDCNLTATIFVRAASQEEAKRLAEKIKIRLESFGNILTAKIDKPLFGANQVGVSLSARIPFQTNLKLGTRNGTVEITNIAKQINVTTFNGEVIAEELSGSTKIETRNGSITCKNITGDARLITYNGHIKIDCSETARSDGEISIVTHNGGIEFTAPSDFSTQLDASAHNGSVNTDLPISVSRNQLKGQIGTGQGKLQLVSHNGSIRIQ